MANLLGDIGRSNLGQLGVNLQNQANQERQFGLAERQEERLQKAQEFDMEQKRMAYNESMKPLQVTEALKNYHPDTQKYLLDQLKGAGIVDEISGVPVVYKKDKQTFMDILSDKRIGREADTIELNGINGRIQTLQQGVDSGELKEAQSKAAQEEISALTQKRQVLLHQLALDKGKQVERTVDLGNQVEYIYTDGTREMKPKGASPNKTAGTGDEFRYDRVAKGNINLAMRRAVNDARIAGKIDFQIDPNTGGITITGGSAEAQRMFNDIYAKEFEKLTRESVRRGSLPKYELEQFNQPKESPQAESKSLTEDAARAILQEAGGDANKARQIARERGYQF